MTEAVGVGASVALALLNLFNRRWRLPIRLVVLAAVVVGVAVVVWAMAPTGPPF